MAEAVFTHFKEGRFVATELARGPWDPGAQHGGAPAALLVRAFERLPAAEDLILARLTYEFLRPVPIGGLEVGAEVVRPGRRVQLLEGSIVDEHGTPLVRARALRVHGADAPATEPEPPPPRPERDASNDYPRRWPMFGTDAMEIRFADGGFLEPGPATAWFRLRAPLVEGSETTPLQRLAAAADFGNGISSVLPWDGAHLFINPDLTVYIERTPVGEWICLQAETRIGAGGIGVAESVLYDSQGRVGRATQALLVSRR